MFFKELKSTLGFSQYSFQQFSAVRAWVEIAITTVLFLEHLRAERMADRRLSQEKRDWWKRQRTHGLCQAFRQECQANDLKYLSQRLKTPGGIKKMKRLLIASIPLNSESDYDLKQNSATSKRASAQASAMRLALARASRYSFTRCLGQDTPKRCRMNNVHEQRVRS